MTNDIDLGEDEPDEPFGTQFQAAMTDAIYRLEAEGYDGDTAALYVHPETYVKARHSMAKEYDIVDTEVLFNGIAVLQTHEVPEGFVCAIAETYHSPPHPAGVIFEPIGDEP